MERFIFGLMNHQLWVLKRIAGVILDYNEENRIIGIELLHMDQEIMSNLMRNLSLDTK